VFLAGNAPLANGISAMAHLASGETLPGMGAAEFFSPYPSTMVAEVTRDVWPIEVVIGLSDPADSEAS